MKPVFTPSVRKSNGKIKLSPDVEDLVECMSSEMINPNDLMRRFILYTALDQLLSHEIVEWLLTQTKSKFGTDVDIANIAKFVRQKALRIFAILVWQEKVKLIAPFYENGFDDDMLPGMCRISFTSSFEEFNVIEADVMHYIVVSTQKGGNDLEHESFTGGIEKLSIVRNTFNPATWKRRQLNSFRDSDQWAFLSPIFTLRTFQYGSFHERCPMPFLEQDVSATRSSNSSQVQKWHIHRDHFQVEDHNVSNLASNLYHRFAGGRKLPNACAGFSDDSPKSSRNCCEEGEEAFRVVFTDRIPQTGAN